MTSDEKRGTSVPVGCTHGWEALRGDSLAWLLDETRPNLHWKVLVELVGRPADSPAVRRARGGANAVEPVAGLLAELMPDDGWATHLPLWSPYNGPGWRLIASVQYGGDPEDPRLHAASKRLIETADGDGGLTRPRSPEPDIQLTARTLETMVALGWGRHSRVQEWSAWFEATEGWEDDVVAAVAVLQASRGLDRAALRRRAADGLTRRLVESRGNNLTTFGHPNLLRTDLAEILGALAGAGVEWRCDWQRLLKKLQHRQDGMGRWERRSPLPVTLGARAGLGPSRWITLKAIKALLTYGVEARLGRVFPHPPGAREP
jgi:hypothetical protein